MKKLINILRLKYRLHTAGARALPDFVIIGAQKAGTTSLYKQLWQHPSLIPNVTPKEIHFFDEHWELGEEWYRSNFPVRNSGKLYYEASPSYLLHPLSPERAASVIPETKILILLRNPIERAYSSYQHQVRAGRETLSFEDALAQESSRIAEDLERLSSGSMVKTNNYRRYSYVERGKYIQQIRQWEKYYSGDNILIIESSELWTEPQRTFNSIFEFLGVDRVDMNVEKKYNTGNYIGGIRDETRKDLSKIFRPYNEMLYAHIKRRFDWD